MHTTSWNKVLAKEGLPVNSFFWQVWDFTRKPTRSEETAKDYMLACRLDRKPQIQSLLDILMAYIFLWGNQPLHCSLSCLSLSLMSICLKCCRKKQIIRGMFESSTQTCVSLKSTSQIPQPFLRNMMSSVNFTILKTAFPTVKCPLCNNLVQYVHIYK